MTDSNSPAPSSNNAVKYALAVVTALAFLWLSFRGTDFVDVLAHSQQVKPIPVFFVLVSVLAGTFLRSYRWTLLLAPMRNDAEKPIGQLNAFYAVMMGYAVNIVLPRGGEVVRLLSICKTERLPWAGVLATMLIDRMLDVAVLAILLGLTLLFLPSEVMSIMPGLVTGGFVLLAAALLGLGLLPVFGNMSQKILNTSLLKRHIPSKFSAKLAELALQFDQGAGALRSFTRYPFIALLSVLIWFTYWLNFYLMVFAFGLEDKINATKCLIIFTIGSVGSLIPTPGSIGSIHYLVKMATVATAHISAEHALAFATTLHLFTFILFPSLIAAVVFLYKWLIPHTVRT
ncbi:MAG: lysylphosphatidylglycerol synthase transmembrane domain-containing protein [Burkholderiaceae bacterium]